MGYRSLRHNYHDSWLRQFTLGPRKEVMLDIELDPVWNRKSSAASASVRCGGIANFAEVEAFFVGLPSAKDSNQWIAEVVGLRYLKHGPNWLILDIAGHGAIQIQSTSVTET